MIDCPLKIKRAFHSFTDAAKPVVDISDLILDWHGLATLVGPSGSGKTTLFRLLLGWFANNPKTICEFDPPFNQFCHVRMVGAHSSLLPWRTIEGNIRAQCRDGGLEWALSGLSKIGLSADVRQAYPSQLSLGMYKRVEVLIAIAAKPSLLLLDELFSSLDEQSKDVTLDLLKAGLPESTRVWAVAHEEDLRSRISPCGFKLVIHQGVVVSVEAL